MKHIQYIDNVLSMSFGLKLQIVIIIIIWLQTITFYSSLNNIWTRHKKWVI